jgi:hypothetical protein
MAAALPRLGGLTPRVGTALVLLTVAVALAASGCKGKDSSPGGGPKTGAPGRGKAPPKTPPPGGYFDAVFGAKRRAELALGMNRLRVLSTALMLYAARHDGKFPASLKDLKQPELLRSPGAAALPYKYVPGQTSDLSANVLVYEGQAVRDGKVLILRVNGSIEGMTPEHLRRELARTTASLARPPSAGATQPTAPSTRTSGG